MAEIKVLRHILRPHKPYKDEAYDPGGDMLIVVHGNPNDPDDPTEFGHHMRLQGLAYRKEMWGLAEYSDVIDMELRDLERFYDRGDDIEYGMHPLAEITEHYFQAPAEQMRTFNPDYVMESLARTAAPVASENSGEFCIATVLSGLDDVRGCLGSMEKKTFPCKGMTGLSTRSLDARSKAINGMGEQTQRLTLVPGEAIDGLRQVLTDRAGDLDAVREAFVGHVLLEAGVPEIMRRRVLTTAAKRGLVSREVLTWI